MNTPTPARLAELEAKERAHDDYLLALQILRQRSASVANSSRILSQGGSQTAARYAEGYNAALLDFAEALLEAGRQRHAVVSSPVPARP